MMSGDEPKGNQFRVVRATDATALMFDDEAVHMYFRTGKIDFAIGVLPPGRKTPMDPGEPGVYVAYVLEGEAVFQAGDGSGATEWLYPGDAVMVRGGLPHVVYNPGAGVSRIIWALAPGHAE